MFAGKHVCASIYRRDVLYKMPHILSMIPALVMANKDESLMTALWMLSLLWIIFFKLCINYFFVRLTNVSPVHLYGILQVSCIIIARCGEQECNNWTMSLCVNYHITCYLLRITVALVRCPLNSAWANIHSNAGPHWDKCQWIWYPLHLLDLTANIITHYPTPLFVLTCSTSKHSLPAPSMRYDWRLLFTIVKETFLTRLLVITRLTRFYN